MRRDVFVLLLGFVSSALVFVAACGPRSSEPETPRSVALLPASTPDASAVAPPASAAQPQDGPASPKTPSADGKPKLCGCSLCEPLVSEDSCSVDADCAPSTPCHAAACVAKAKAIPKTPQTMCTMMMACHSADANRCGCHQGRCALVPRP